MRFLAVILEVDAFSQGLIKVTAAIFMLAVLTAAIYFFMSFIGVVFGLEVRLSLRRPTRKNKIWAHTILGMHMLYSDRSELNAQMGFFVRYLKRIFPEAELSRDNILANFKSYPYSDELAKWIGKHFSETEKLILIELLIDLAFHDHQFARRELAVVYRVTQLIGLEKQDVQSLLRIRYEQKKRTEEWRKKQRHGLKQKTAKVMALQILGLPASTSEVEEVRRAYRSLARKHHPDRFVRASEDEQQLAHHRFSEISAAHDLLLKSMG
jgi:DnaJ like chaperone protein